MTGMYMPYAINLANKRGLRFDEEGKTVGSFVDDYIQAGLLGIYEAAKHFDPTKKISFTTYAWYWMIQGFGNVVEQSEVIRFPRNVKLLKNKISRFTSKRGFTTNAEELSAYLKETEASVQRALEYDRAISLEKPVFKDSPEDDIASALADGYNVEDEVCKNSQKDEVASIINTNLNEREKMFINMRFGLSNYSEHTFREIASKVNMTTEGVRQAVKNAMRKIIPDIVNRFGGDYGEQDTEKVLALHSKGKE
jgi:RNA polymerase primary sigma factor